MKIKIMFFIVFKRNRTQIQKNRAKFDRLVGGGPHNQNLKFFVCRNNNLLF